MGTIYLVKYVIVIYRINETILILISMKCYFSYPKKSITNAQVTHSRTGRRIGHGYNPALFVAIRIGP